MLGALDVYAQNNQACIVSPFILAGAMSPVTVTGTLTQVLCEVLAGAAFSQLVRPGAPIIFGTFAANISMQTGAPTFGTPEPALVLYGAAQLARRTGLPFRSGGALCGSKAPDAQAAYESNATIIPAVMGGVNFMLHSAGWMEGGLCASFEKLVLDVEMLQHMIAFLDPIATDENALAFEAMKDVPIGGHFFGTPHTLARYETAFYQPMVSDWQNYEAWELAGAKTATERATVLWQQALDEYEEPTLDPVRAEALDAYVATRKEAIGTGEP